MYICSDCGTVFDYNDIRWYMEPHGEETPSCPHCGGDIEDAQYCRECGEAYLEDDLQWGFCDECLKNLLTFDSFLEFATHGYSDTECSMFEEFMFTMIYKWDEEDVPTVSSELFRNLMISEFNKLRKSTYEYYLMDSIVEFMRMYMYDFAEYFAWKEVKQCTKQKELRTYA